MSQNTTLDKIADSLRSSLDVAKLLAEAERRVGGVAALGLIAAVETALHDLADVRMELLRDELAETLPRLSGGAPDDFEDVSSEFLRDPMSWPDESDEIYFSPFPATELSDPAEWPAWNDADSWAPTPLEVLEASRPRFEPSDEDWADYFTHRDYPLSEADHILAHGCV